MKVEKQQQPVPATPTGTDLAKLRQDQLLGLRAGLILLAPGGQLTPGPTRSVERVSRHGQGACTKPPRLAAV